MHTTDFQGLHTSKQSPSVDTYREIMCRDACWNLTLRYLHRYSSLWIHSALNNDLMNDNRPPHFSGKIASDWLTLDPASTLHVGTKPSLISSRMLRVGYVLWCMLRVKKEYGEQCPHVAALQAWCLSHRLPYFPPPPRISRWYVYIYTAHCVNCAHSRRLPFLRWIYGASNCRFSQNTIIVAAKKILNDSCARLPGDSNAPKLCLFWVPCAKVMEVFEVVLGDVEVVDILLLFLFDLYSRWVYVGV